MSANPLAKYYQDNKKRLQKKLVKDIGIWRAFFCSLCSKLIFIYLKKISKKNIKKFDLKLL